MDSNIRILFLAASDDMYGSDVVLVALLKRLDKDLVEPVVVVPSDVDLPGRLRTKLNELGVQCHQYPLAVVRREYLTPLGSLRYLVLLIRSVLWLLSFVRRERVELIHTNSSLIIPGALVSTALKVPHVWHIHEVPAGPNILQRIQGKLFAKLGTTIVAVSNHVSAAWGKIEPAIMPKVTVVPNGVDLKRFHPDISGESVRAEFGIAEEQPVVGVIGRISRRKGQREFIAAVASLAHRFPRARFLIVGDVFPGHESELLHLRTLVDQYHLHDRVLLSPYREDISHTMAALDLLVLPSVLPEAFPTVILEAMASAKPVVVTSCGGAEELVVDGETGLVIPMGDSRALAQAITHLLSNPDCAKSMGRAGRLMVEQEFSVESFGIRFSKLYQELASSLDEHQG